ncbi:uncharacterized protein LOC9655520 isoform X1 [Selaginella moellendorffii]|uniref:uncharacterized protein LOC9655520 isoform X1 n=1 Tax=Selaginella moellendorffii TaxID=88036 RepID=UPI000D1CE00F|nr:uncharacterized protein LOC9655520 isoform X1 [Selaginella moellendorffii]|eukprot:XP_024524730.1 uncharacterized protein LOC9655520 isoform X1 [Selaginella moellendorffii]
MSGARAYRNGSSTAQLPPLPRISKIPPKVWGMQHQSTSSRDWSSKFCRFLSNRRTGLYVAAFLACISLLMLVSDFSIVSLPRPPLQGEKQRSIFGSTNAANETSEAAAGAASVVEYLRLLPPTSFLDPPLPHGHPCESFTMPPPPADKKRTGPRPCPVCYLPVEEAKKLYPPSGVFPSLIVQNLTYVREDASTAATSPGSAFGGHPTLEDRKRSHKIEESMHLYCGFARGIKPGVGSGFDIDEFDLYDMEKCHGIVVISAIFGNYDPLQQPKHISEHSKKNVCFFMFVDEETQAAIIKRGGSYSRTKKVGLWRVVTVHNIPYLDPRRTGKIPKLLSHRLFPNARFSLWIDGKLELVVDPYQIMERFLWRTHDTFAISKHYKRFDVFTEAEANKLARKYNNASIDAQVNFYRKEGLVPYTTAKLPIVSDVPEGCVIVREHTPLTNLFTCLWFNEVDRFTSRDQISFGIVRDKIMAQVPWRINMFLDCQRRNFVVQGYHRDVIEQRRASSRRPPAPELSTAKAPRQRLQAPIAKNAKRVSHSGKVA